MCEVAEEAGYSPFHYQRLFVRAFGESPHQFLTRLRLEKAQQMLRTSTAPISQICLDLGYESLGTFSSLFGREVGTSASQFRRIYSVPGLWELKSTPACFRRLAS